jgi:hypothetical protein
MTDLTDLTDAERETLIEAIQAGNEAEFVQSIIDARTASLRSALSEAQAAAEITRLIEVDDSWRYAHEQMKAERDAATAEVRRVHTAIEALRTDLWPKCVTGWSLPGDVNNAVDHALRAVVGANPVTGKEKP